MVAGTFFQSVGPAERALIFSGMARVSPAGGILLLQGYGTDQLKFGTGGPKQIENLHTESLLRESFRSLEILHLVSHEHEVAEGRGHVGRSALVDLIARRPVG